MAEASLELLQTLVLRVLEEQREIRREVSDVRSIVLGLFDQCQRIDRRFGELRREVGEVKDEVELMLKAEIMGRQGNFETRIDARLDGFAERVAALERPE